MRIHRSGQVAATLGLCLVTVLLLRPGWPRYRSLPSGPAPPLPPQPPRTRAAAARRVALCCWVRAEQAANRERYAVETWDPAGADALLPEAWRFQLMAADPTGDMHRALEAAKHAAALARTPGEKYESALLLACLESDAGHVQAELKQARILMALQPHNMLSLIRMQHAARRAEGWPFTRSRKHFAHPRRGAAGWDRWPPVPQ